MISTVPRRMYESGMSVAEIADALQYSQSWIYQQLKSEGVVLRKQGRGFNARKMFAIYDRSDRLLCVGTYRECSAFLGIKPNSFYCVARRSNQYRNPRHRIVRLDEGD